MEWPKLKNIMLIILLITNLFLLSLVGLRSWNTSRYQAQARENALKVLAQNGIAMEAALLPADQAPQAATLVREREGEAQALLPLLGETSETAMGGGQYRYSSAKGDAVFMNRGEFHITLGPDTAPAEGELTQHAVKLLSRVGFEGIAYAAQGDQEAGSVQLIQTWNGIPVRGCIATAVYQGGSLLSLTGTRLQGTPASAGELELSAVTALLRFVEKLSETGGVCSRISDMRVEYQLTTGLSEPSLLLPVWYFETDAGSYLLDTATNQLTRL